MFRGIYTATNAMQTKQRKIQTITNNIANVDTTGYKKDVDVLEAFSEKLLYKRNNSQGYLRATRNNVKVEKKQLKNGKTLVDFDITRGYLQLEDKNGKGYYKSASLSVDDDGYLRTVYRDYNSKQITKFGAYLLDSNNNKIKVDNSDISLDNNGNLISSNRIVAKVVIPEPRKTIGTMNSGVLTDRVMINFKQGFQETTQNPMHISLEGNGFFKVRINDNNQVKYSRNGAFTMDKDRFLTDHLGNKILSENLENIEIPQNSRKIEFAKDGTVFSVNDDSLKYQIGKLALVDIENKEDMQKYGYGYFQMINNSDAVEKKFEGKVLQGYLEKSNVNPIDEMVDMIEMYRGFEIDQKVINTYDQIMQKAANEIGKI